MKAVATCTRFLALYLCTTAIAQDPPPAVTGIVYPDIPTPYVLAERQNIKTSVWEFVHSGGRVAKGTWRYADEADPPLFTWEHLKYASELGSNGLLIVYWDAERTRKYQVLSSRNGCIHGAVVYFWPDGSIRRLELVEHGSWRGVFSWHRNGRLAEVVPPEGPVGRWDSNGVSFAVDSAVRTRRHAQTKGTAEQSPSGDRLKAPRKE